MKTVWHEELFSDCCPTFGVQSVRPFPHGREIQGESSLLATSKKVKVRPRSDHANKTLPSLAVFLLLVPLDPLAHDATCGF